jgi:hypothetical protein
MLNLLRTRCERSAPNTRLRLQTHQIEALSYLAATPFKTCDLVVTHFFLDCLTQSEVESLAATISTRLTPGAIWLISDFRIPSGLMRLPAKLLVRTLYLAFRILTGLRTDRLPDHASALTRAGFSRISHNHSLFGIFTSEIWTVTTSAS